MKFVANLSMRSKLNWMLRNIVVDIVYFLPNILFPILPSYLLSFSYHPSPNAAPTSLFLGGRIFAPPPTPHPTGVCMWPKLFNQRISALLFGRLGQELSFLWDNFLCWFSTGSETTADDSSSACGWSCTGGGRREPQSPELSSSQEPGLPSTPSPLDFSS